MQKFYYRIMTELETEEKSFENIYRKAFSFGDHVMFESSENMMISRLTYAECEAMVKKVAYSLQQRLKDQKGRAVGILMHNSHKWAAAFFGTLMAGYKPLLLNTAADSRIIERCMYHSNAAALITDEPGEGAICFDELLNDGEPQPDFEDEIILCTSGTMGEPKLCAYNGRQITAQLITARYIVSKNPEIKDYYDKTGDTMKILTLLPFCHIYGLVANLLWFSVFGQTFIELKNMNPDVIANTCRLHRVTHIFAPPLLWNTLEKTIMRTAKKEGLDKKLEKGIKLSTAVMSVFPNLGRSLAKKLFEEVQSQAFGDNVYYCISGGGCIEPSTLRLINGIGYFLTNGYGMTEIGITSLVLSRNPKKRSTGTVGFPLPSCEYSIDENGMLKVRGESCFIASYRDGERIARDGSEWFSTGDIFELTKNGYVFKGRNDDMINGANGERIGPDAVEACFKSDRIRNICVFADNRADRDRIILVVEPVSYRADVIRLLSEELMRINGALPSVMRAEELLISRSALPVSLNAKVSRTRVKSAYIEGSLGAVSAADSVKTELSEAMSEAKAELLKDIIACFAEATSNEEDKISADTSFIYDLNGNSMEYYMLLDKIEQKTGVRVDGALALSTPSQFADKILEGEE